MATEGEDTSLDPLQPRLPGITVNQNNYNQTLIHANYSGFLSVDMVHVMEKYNPGAAKKMMKMAETGQKAIIDSNYLTMKLTQIDVRRVQLIQFAGQAMLFLSIISSLGASLYSVHLGASWLVSCALAGWPVAKGVQEVWSKTHGN